MKKEKILSEVAKIGKDLARSADPGTYSAEDHWRAKGYQPKLEAIRKAYQIISHGGDAIKALLVARKVIATGIEWNQVARLMEKIEKETKPRTKSVSARSFFRGTPGRGVDY